MTFSRLRMQHLHSAKILSESNGIDWVSLGLLFDGTSDHIAIVVPRRHARDEDDVADSDSG